ncbi:unnamed protein product [Calypogeia fissa]
MADKDKKKLKVILKLPPKSSSSAQPKSSPATAPPGGGGVGGVSSSAAGVSSAVSGTAAGGGGANVIANAKASSVAGVAAAGGGFAFSGSASAAAASLASSGALPPPTAGAAPTGASFSHQFGSAGSKDHHNKQHRSSGSGSKNLQSGHHSGHSGRHGGILLPPGANASAGVLSSGPALFPSAGSFSSVRSSGITSAGGPSSSSSSFAAPAATGGAGGQGSASFGQFSSPPGSSSHAHAPTPPKKRKFKTVEHAGPLGVGAVIVGRVGASGSVIASDGPGSGRDAEGGAGAGGTTRVGGGEGAGGAGTGAGGKGGQGGGREAGGREVGVSGGAAGGRTGLQPAPTAPVPVKKSHKKQIKPSTQTDGPQARNPFAGVIMPEKTPSEPLSKTMLEGVLEKLQKKDTYAVFAEPVDATQVPDYYDIIKEPMDFGTMRKKIKKGSYKTVEDFEGDIYLICSNAMRYNGPETIYYKQARTIRDMARKALEGIRGQLAGEVRKPVSHKKKLPPPSKKSHVKKPSLNKVRLDGTGSDFASGATLAGDGEHLRGWGNSTVDTGTKAKKGMSMEKLVGLGEDSQDAWVSQPVGKESKTETQEEPSGAALKPMGPKDGRRPLSSEEYHRNTYKQRLLPAHGQGPPLVAIGGESRQLVPVGNQVEHAYAKSLAKFGVGLGPRAWLFIAKRLEQLKAPTLQPGTTNDPLAGKEVTVPVPTQTGAPTSTHPSVGGQSGGFGGDRASSTSHSGQVVDAVPKGPSRVAHSGQVVGSSPSRPSGSSHPGQVDSIPTGPSISSNVGQAVVSTPSNPTGVARVGEAVVSTPSQTTGASNVGEAVVSSQKYPSGGSQVGQVVLSSSKVPSGGASHGAKSAISASNHPSQAGVSITNFPFGPPHTGQAVGSNAFSGSSHVGQVSGSSLNSSGLSHVGQAPGSSFSSSGPLHVQNPTSFALGSTIGTSDRTPVKNLQVSAQQGESSFDTQQERRNGRLDNARSDPGTDSLVHTSGTKQILGLDNDVASEDRNARRLGWTPVTSVDQAVSGLALTANSKAFSQAWSATPLKHGSTSYAYAPLPLSAGRDETNAQAQAWAQARVMSLANPADAKRNLSREAQVLAFLSQNRDLPSDFATNVPQILQSNVYADYNSRPRQSSGLLLSTAPIPQTQDQQAEGFGNKSGGAEPKGSSPGPHSQGNLRPAPLQQNALQQRAMPPDLNVALLSPSALQSPPTQQGSTPTSARHPDLKLQL